MILSEPAVLRTLMWCQAGQISSLFGWLNGKICNSNHFPSGFISKPYCFTKFKLVILFQLASIFQLGGDFCALTPSGRETHRLCREEFRELERQRKHDIYSEFMACLVRCSLVALRQQVETCLPLWESEILIRKKLLASTAIKIVHWLVIWSNAAKMTERSKESSRNLKVMPHSSSLTAWLRIRMLCVFPQWFVLL